MTETDEVRMAWPAGRRKEICDFLYSKISGDYNAGCDPGLSTEQIFSQELARAAAAYCLGLVEPRKGLGTELFDAIAKHSISVPFEAILLRDNPQTGLLEVFMTRRGAHDTAYASQLHAPGTIMRPGEVVRNNYVRSCNRLSQKEFASLLTSYELVDLVGGTEARGTMISFVFLVQASRDPVTLGHGAWYPVDRLPEDTVDAHLLEIIPRAAAEYRFRRRWWVKALDWLLSSCGARVVRINAFR